MDIQYMVLENLSMADIREDVSQMRDRYGIVLPLGLLAFLGPIGALFLAADFYVLEVL